MRVGCVLMASGFARRFGGNKLLAQVEGIPLIQRVFDALPPALFARAVVTSRYPEILALAEQAGYLPLENRWAQEGAAAGVRLGLSAMGDMDGVLFSVCDQPWLRRESVEGLIAAFRASPERIYALSFQGERGNPVVFPNALFPALLALKGDVGGGAVLRRRPELVRLVEAGFAAELWDVDTPGDLSGPQCTAQPCSQGPS